MCMTIAAHSLDAWLASQERMMRAWVAEVALDPDADLHLVERLESHCRWLAQERAWLAAAASFAPERAAAG